MTKSALKYEQFGEILLREVPSLRMVFDEHLKQHDEILLHVLMGDVTRFLISKYREVKAGAKDAEGAAQLVRALLAILEAAMASPDDKLQELVSVSFLENLHQAESDYDGIKELLGPALSKELRALDSGSAASGRTH